MTHAYFTQPLEGVATFWRIYRRDGMTLGFVSHDRDLRFGGILHRAAPGILPSAVRKTSDLQPDIADITGALSHASIEASALAAGKFDEARIEMGPVDWETGEFTVVHTGQIGTVSREGEEFRAELRSAKSALDRDIVSRTSPTCRAAFCGRGCNLDPQDFTTDSTISDIDSETGRISLGGVTATDLIGGWVRPLSGPMIGQKLAVLDAADDWLVIDTPLHPEMVAGVLVEAREGCDHTIATCASRFGNAINFRGEPALPGNDLLSRYAKPE